MNYKDIVLLFIKEKHCQMETFWLIGRDKDIEENGIDEC